MAGASISLLPDSEDSSFTTLLDAPTNAHAWIPAADLLADTAKHHEETDEYMETLISGSKPVTISGGTLKATIMYINIFIIDTHMSICRAELHEVYISH